MCPIVTRFFTREVGIERESQMELITFQDIFNLQNNAARTQYVMSIENASYPIVPIIKYPG